MLNNYFLKIVKHISIRYTILMAVSEFALGDKFTRPNSLLCSVLHLWFFLLVTKPTLNLYLC